MEITRGKVKSAKKVVCYGPEGIGKSTFASRFPNAVFIDTEGSTKDMDVARLPRPSSWEYLLQEIQYVKDNPGICGSLVIDTVDWAEQLCVEHICDKHRKDGIESFGYGTGYVYTKEEFGRFLNKLEDLVEAGINVVLTAHAHIKKFEQPDEMGAYDRWELKLGKKTSSQTAPLVKEWADMLLFVNYKTYSVAVDDKGKKHKGQGGKRIMYTSHHPCWDAKNRYGLPDECEFEYGVIRHIVEGSAAERDKTMKQPEEKKENKLPDFMSLPEADIDEELDFDTGEKLQEGKKEQKEEKPEEKGAKPEADMSRSEVFRLNDYIPKALQDLMYVNLVSEEELLEAVYQRGFFPRSTPFQNLPDEFIDGCLIAAWPKVMAVINEIRSKQEIPFD